MEFSEVFFCTGKFKGASGAAGKGKGVKRKWAQAFKPPPMAVMQGNEEALLDAGLEGDSAETWVWYVCVHGVCVLMCE